MSDYDRRRDIESEGQRALMVPPKPDLSKAGKGASWKIGYRAGFEAQAARIAELEAALATARADALREAADVVHQECWTDGDGGPATETLLAEQATTALAVRAILALIPHRTEKPDP